MRSLLNRFNTYLTLLGFVGTLLLPTARAVADECSSLGIPCSTVTVGGESVTYPQLNLTALATYNSAGSGGFNVALSKGDQKQVDLNTAAQSLGVSSSQIAQVVSTLPASSTIVFSRFSPLNGVLDVNILKVLRKGTTTTLYVGKFSPEMGNRWAASRTFMTPAEKAASTGPGPNPFSAYEGGDLEFHNLPQAGSAQAETITGLAARFVNAPMAIVQIANFNLQEWVTTAHHFFTTTTTVHTAGYENPVWMVGLPSGMNPTGDVSPNYCLDALDGQSCDVSQHQVVSGLSWSNWNGGNLPDSVQTVHEFDVSHTGLNVLVVALVLAAVSFGIFAEVAPALLIADGASTAAAAEAEGVIGSLLNVGLEAVGATASIAIDSAAVGAALDGLTYIAAAYAVDGTGPFSADNLLLSNQATVSGGEFTATNSDEVYFQQIEDQAMTSTLGQSSTQVDSSGNNGFQAFSGFDQGYNNDVAPTPNVNLQFNSTQFIQDTQ